MTERREALLPCPFCGERGELNDAEVTCQNCEAVTFGWDDSMAVGRWNRRANALRDEEGLREAIVEEMTAWKVRCTPWMNASYDEPLDTIIAAVKERL